MDNFLFQQQQQLAQQQHHQHVQQFIQQQHQQLVQHHIDQHQRFVDRSRQTAYEAAKRRREDIDRLRKNRGATTPKTRNNMGLRKKLLVGAIPGAGLGASLYAAHYADRARKVRNAALLTAGIGAAGMASYYLTHD